MMRAGDSPHGLPEPPLALDPSAVTVAPLRTGAAGVALRTSVRVAPEHRVRELEARLAELDDAAALARSVLDASLDCVKTLDAEGRVLTVNAPGLQLLDMQDERCFQGTSWPAYWRAGGCERVAGDAVEAALEGRTTRFAGYCPTAQGRPKWWDVVVSPVRDADGGVRRVLAVSRDVTEQTLAQQQERAQRRVLELVATGASLQEVLDEVCALMERQLPGSACTVLLLDEGTQRFQFGAAPSAPDYGHAFDGAPMRDGLGTCGTACARGVPTYAADIASDPMWSGIAHIPLGHGLRACWSAPIRAGDGRVLGCLAVYWRQPRTPAAPELATRDAVVHLASVAIERHRTAAAAAESARRFRAVLESVQAIGLMLDREGRVTFANDFLLELTGWHAEEILGRSWFDLCVPPSLTATDPEAKRVTERFPLAISTGALMPHAEHDILTRTGERRRIAWDNTVLRGLDGELIGTASIGHDVTVDREVERERLQLEATLRDADRRKDEFLATLAHELRNPLAPIRNALQILNQAADPSVTAQARAMMGRQLGQLVRLVDDLLDISRISTGKLKLDRERLDVRRIVEQAIETSRPHVDARRHRLVFEPPERELRVVGDLVRLSQIVTNLLNNAAKYSDPGGSITVRIRASRPGRVAISVQDTGIGIGAEHLPRVFDLFAQISTGRDRAHGGLGIGLALARRLAELQDGTLVAESAGVGAGATFTLELPLAADLTSATRDHAEAAAVSAGALRVVIVDDNRDAADSLALLLKLSGHDVSTTYDGRAAIHLIRASRPDVSIVDLGMPGCDGYEVARTLRADGHAGLLIALTGWGQEDDKRRTREAGFDHHFTKPVEPEALARALAGTAGLTASTADPSR